MTAKCNFELQKTVAACSKYVVKGTSRSIWQTFTGSKHLAGQLLWNWFCISKLISEHTTYLVLRFKTYLGAHNQMHFQVQKEFQHVWGPSTGPGKKAVNAIQGHVQLTSTLAWYPNQVACPTDIDT